MTHTKTYAKALLEVNAKVWDDKPFVLRESIADAALPDGTKVHVDKAVSNSTLYIQHGDGQVYEIEIEALCHAVLKAEEA